jgi:hypothetical protein
MGLGYCDLNLKARNKAEAHTLCRAALEGDNIFNLDPMACLRGPSRNAWRFSVLIFLKQKFYCIFFSAGYKVVAINTEVDANVFAKRGKKDPPKTLPSPLDLNSLHEVYKTSNFIINY